MPDQAKEAFVTGHKSREASKNDAEFGTKASGFSKDGPFSCDDCVHKKMSTGHGVCVHPKVNADPELENMARASGFVVVDKNYCCRYVRPH